MKKLLLLAPLLVGCTNAGMGSINWSNPGVADSYTCEEVTDQQTIVLLENTPTYVIVNEI